MKNRHLVKILLLSMLVSGCTSVLVVRDGVEPPGLSVFDTANVSQTLLSMKDDVYISFNNVGCPILASPVFPNCPPGFGGAICRKENQQIKFVSAEDPSPAFAIVFEGYEPCPLSAVPKPGTKVCNINAKSNWPGGGESSLLVKYKVTTENACELDPYIVLMR